MYGGNNEERATGEGFSFERRGETQARGRTKGCGLRASSERPGKLKSSSTISPAPKNLASLRKSKMGKEREREKRGKRKRKRKAPGNDIRARREKLAELAAAPFAFLRILRSPRPPPRGYPAKEKYEQVVRTRRGGTRLRRER
jgi:hypothetical protein